MLRLAESDDLFTWRRIVNGRPLLGFRNLEADASALEIVDPIPVALRDGELIDLR